MCMDADRGVCRKRHTCVRTGAVSLGNLLVFSSQPTATQMKMSLKEALEVAATTSPVIMLCTLDPATQKVRVHFHTLHVCFTCMLHVYAVHVYFMCLLHMCVAMFTEVKQAANSARLP